MYVVSIPPICDTLRHHKVFTSPDIPRHTLPDHLRIKNDEKPKKAEDLYKKIMEVRKEEFQREHDMKKEEEERDMEMRKKLLAMIENREFTYQQEKDTMFPVPDEIRQILYNGVSKSGEGRFLYLKTRNQLAPYEKFRQRITETQGYGWKIEDFAERPVKDFNRTAVIKNSFYRRFGAIKPDSLRKNPPFSKAQVTVEVL